MEALNAVLRNVRRDLGSDHVRVFHTVLRSDWVRFLILAVAGAAIAAAQPSVTMAQPSAIIRQYNLLMHTWYAMIFPYALSLFWLLVSVDWAWGAIGLMRHGTLHDFTWGVIMKIMTVGVFYAVLLNAGTWFPAIIDSLALIGVRASGFTLMLSPSDVFSIGVNLAGMMLNNSWNSGWMAVVSPGPALATMFAACMIFLAFTGITIMLVMALVQSYLLVGSGAIFCAFGGSRWTREYMMRYLGLAIGSGIRLMLLNMLVGAGMILAAQWVGLAQQIPNDPSPVMGELAIAGGALIFLAVVWETPRMVASQLSGMPQFTGFEMLAVSSSLAGSLAGGAMIGGRIGQSVGSAMSSGASVSAGTGSVSIAQAASGGSGSQSNGSGASTVSSAASGGSGSSSSTNGSGSPAGQRRS